LPRAEDRSSILLPIHPRFAEALLNGSKTVELRRTKLPTDLSSVVVYSTNPVMRVVGWLEVKRVERDRPVRLWRRFGEQTGVSRQEFFAYFEGADQGTAIVVRRAHGLSRPIALSTLGLAKAPQGFCYLSPSALGKVVARARG
jgi:predicted transcriptional regulator